MTLFHRCWWWGNRKGFRWCCWWGEICGNQRNGSCIGCEYPFNAIDIEYWRYINCSAIESVSNCTLKSTRNFSLSHFIIINLTLRAKVFNKLERKLVLIRFLFTECRRVVFLYIMRHVQKYLFCKHVFCDYGRSGVKFASKWDFSLQINLWKCFLDYHVVQLKFY